MRPISAEALKELRHEYIQGRLKFDGSEYDLIDKCPTLTPEELRGYLRAVTEPCEYCSGKQDIPLDTDVGQTWIEGTTMHNAYGECTIKCCPMCGRELEGA